jgi:AcrR family transcriptional regulator
MKKPKQTSNRVAAPAPQPAAKRSAGRPAVLSAPAIIAAALQMLETCTTDELSFAKLASRFGVAPMTLYNYFANREALLNAVADHAFSLFKMPKARAQQSWQQQLLAWLWALQRHCKQHPVVLKVMGFDGGVSPAWVATVTPAYRLLRERGLSGRELSQVSSWFVADAMGLIIAEALMPIYRRPAGLAHLEALDADALEIHLSLRKYMTEISSDEWLEFGFNRLLASLEQIVETYNQRAAK